MTPVPIPDLRPAWSRTWCVCWKPGAAWGLLPLEEVAKLNGMLVLRGESGYQIVAVCDGLEAAQAMGREWKRKMRGSAESGTRTMRDGLAALGGPRSAAPGEG